MLRSHVTPLLGTRLSKLHSTKKSAPKATLACADLAGLSVVRTSSCGRASRVTVSPKRARQARERESSGEGEPVKGRSAEWFRDIRDLRSLTAQADGRE